MKACRRGGGGGGGVDVHCEVEVMGNYSQKKTAFILLERITMVACLEADPPRLRDALGR